MTPLYQLCTSFPSPEFWVPMCATPTTKILYETLHTVVVLCISPLTSSGNGKSLGICHSRAGHRRPHRRHSRGCSACQCAWQTQRRRRSAQVYTSYHHLCPFDSTLTEGVQLGHGFSVCVWEGQREREWGRERERERERERVYNNNNVHTPKTRLVHMIHDLYIHNTSNAK